MLPKSSTWQQNRLCNLTKTSWTDLMRKGLDFVAGASLMFILVRREGLSYLTQLKKDAEKPTSVALCFCPRHEMLSSLFLWIYLNRRLCLWSKHLPLWPATSTWSYVNTGPVYFEKSIWSTVFFVNIIPSIQRESLCRVSQEGLLYILFCALQVKGECWICLWKYRLTGIQKKPWIIMCKYKYCMWSKRYGSYLWWNIYVFPRVGPS